MGDLIERLEALTSPNFAIEQEIGRMVNPQATSHTVFPPYTVSVDAAMALLPEAGFAEINAYNGHAESGKDEATVWPVYGEEFCQHGEGATTAIAICIAALKAMTPPQKATP